MDIHKNARLTPLSRAELSANHDGLVDKATTETPAQSARLRARQLVCLAPFAVEEMAVAGRLETPSHIEIVSHAYG